MKYFLSILGLFISVHFLTAQSCSDLVGLWQNEHGSILEITAVTSEKVVKGRYLSHEGTEPRTFPLLGWVQKKNLKRPISFTVHWEENGTLTSWTGYCNASDTTIYTMWYLINPYTEYDYQHWSSNASQFTPYKKKGK